MAPITTQDLNSLRDFLVAHMDTSFGRTHTRLDAINGRVARVEADARANDIRLQALERALEKDKPGADEDRKITQRDVNIVLATFSVAAATGFFVWEVLPVVSKAVLAATVAP